MKDRSDILAALGHGIKTWTVDGVTVSGPEDQQQFETMLEKFHEHLPSSWWATEHAPMRE